MKKIEYETYYHILDYLTSSNEEKKKLIKEEKLGWINISGETIRIYEMDDSYLNNCISLIENRYPHFRPSWLEYLKKVKEKRKIKGRKEKIKILKNNLKG
jgi:hypothetical protein